MERRGGRLDRVGKPLGIGEGEGAASLFLLRGHALRMDGASPVQYLNTIDPSQNHQTSATRFASNVGRGMSENSEFPDRPLAANERADFRRPGGTVVTNRLRWLGMNRTRGYRA